MPIGGVVSKVMGALGAKKGSSSWEQKTFQTKEQKELFDKTLKGYKDLEYEGPGEYKEGQKAEDLEGFKKKNIDELRSLQDESQLSVKGLDALRNMRATSATQVNPDIEALRGLSDNAWSSGDAHMRDVTTRAREELNKADIASRRGQGAVGGTAAARLGAANIGNYGRTVGEAAARVAEQTAMQRQQLAMQGRMQAGQLGMGLNQLGLQGQTNALQMELGQQSNIAGDLRDRRNIESRESQFGAGLELDTAKFSEQQAQAKNLWSQTNAQNKNQFMLNKLRDQTAASNVRTFKNVKNVKKGSAGLGGALISAAGQIGGGMLGGPMGAQIGSSLANSMVGSMGYGDGGGGMGGGAGGGMGGFGGPMAMMGGMMATGMGGGGGMPAAPGGPPAPGATAGGGGGFWNNMFGGGSTPAAPMGGGRGDILNMGPGASPEMAGAWQTPGRYSLAQNQAAFQGAGGGGPESYNLGHYGTQRGNTYGKQFNPYGIG